MFSDIENLKLTSVSAGVTSGGKSYVKKRNSLIYRSRGSVLYDLEDTQITQNTGELIFIPRGTACKVKKMCENCEYVSINFDADMQNPKPVLYSVKEFSASEYLFTHFPELWNFGTPADRHKCYSLFYDLLSYISNIENSDYAIKKKFEIITPAVNHLKKHIFDCNLKCDTLYTLCGISNTYFRKIFAAKFGTTPQQYIINRRISQAKHLIESGDFLTISEVAAAVGYSDPLYFSRTFKKKYGVSPSKI